jgi:two-component system response regulator RegA
MSTPVVRPILDPRILIVEDESRMRELLHRAITSWGLSAVACKSGEDALRHLGNEEFHIVLLDLNLPGMSGMELFEKVRQAWPDAQVIVLTGFGDLETARKAIHLGVVEFLTKPCHLGELEVAIDRAKRKLIEVAEQAEAESLPPETPEPSGAKTLEEVEREHILAALARNNGNRSATATELGISLRTLYYRLNEYQQQGFQID